jgi:uncharacterized membrane protein
MSDRAERTQRIVLVAWFLLAASVAIWPFAGAGISAVFATIAFLPLLLPFPGLVRASSRALRASPMALAPALALATTEILVNPAARPIAGATIGLALAAFAAVVAALRAAPRG